MITDDKAVKALCEIAFKNKQSKFEFIKNIDEYRAAIICKKATKDIYISFKRTANSLIKDYLKQIPTGDIQLLISYKKILHCINFYKKELEIITDIIFEYKCYLHNGHTKEQALGYERLEEDLVDFRACELVQK